MEETALVPHPSSLIPHPSSGPRAHTLPELLIVLTILVIFAAIAIPRFVASMEERKLDTAVHQLKDDLVYARTRAVSTGIRHMVTLDRQTGELTVLPYRPEEDSGAGAAPAAAAAAQAQPEPALKSRLPEEVHVTQWTVSPLGYETGQAPAMTSTQQDQQPLTFYPQERSDSAIIVLEGPSGRRVGVAVDSFTGEIRDLTGEELARM